MRIRLIGDLMKFVSMKAVGQPSRARSRWSRLLRYDLTMFRNALTTAFIRVQDKVLLALVLTVGGAWMTNPHSGSGVRISPYLIAAMFLLGLTVQAKLSRRLDDLGANSALAADALEVVARRRYVIVWHLTIILTASAAAILLKHPLLALIVIAYVGGALLAVFWSALPRPWFLLHLRARSKTSARSTKLQSTWAAMTSAVAKRQVGVSDQPAWMIFIVVSTGLLTTTIAGVAQNAATQPVAEGIFALAGISFAAWLSRVDHAIVRFTALVGHGPWKSVAAHAVALAVESFVMIGSVSPLGARFVFLGLLIFAGGLIVLTFRVLSYRLYTKKQADLVLAITFGAAAFIGWGAPFVLPPMLVGLLISLGLRARSATWLAA